MLKKIRVIHTAQQSMPSSGIVNQMLWEQNAALELDLNWQVKVFCPMGSVGENPVVHFADHNPYRGKPGHINRLKSRNYYLRNYYSWLKSIENDYDIFLMRYNTCDPFQYWYIKNSKKPVYLVHHALELPELALTPNPASRFIRCQLEEKIGKHAIKKAAGLIGVTHEILAFERARANNPTQKGYVYPNGIEFSTASAPDHRTPKIELLFVASFFAPWHGLDLLLDAIKNTQEQFVLHVVGDMTATDLQTARSDPRVQIHGRLSQTEIAALASRCTIGLGSFAIERKKMVEGCSLKIREYLMLGLPVYAGFKEVFDDQFEFYRQNQCDIHLILNYAKQMQAVPRENIITASKSYISKKSLLLKLYNQIRDDYHPVDNLK